MNLGDTLQIGSLNFAETHFNNFSAIISVCPFVPNWCGKHDEPRQELQFEEHIDDSIHHLIVPCLDDLNEPIFKHFDTVNKFIDKYINTGKVLIHCVAGISRSSSFCLAYYMCKNKCGYAKSMHLLRNVYSNSQPNDGFVRQLILYEKYKWSIPDYDQFLLEAKTYSDELIKSNSDRVIRLFYEKNVWNHKPKQNKICHSIFIEPMDWMSGLNEQSGKLICKNEKCSAKLGSFIWHGNKCNCGYRQIPSFQIHLNKVDKILLADPVKFKGENPQPLFN